MQTFRVDDMTCGHCASSITKALKDTDPNARVSIDLRQHLVTVESSDADAQELRNAIAQAGYTPVPLEAAAMLDRPAKAGGCCGCCG